MYTHVSTEKNHITKGMRNHGNSKKGQNNKYAFLIQWTALGKVNFFQEMAFLLRQGHFIQNGLVLRKNGQNSNFLREILCIAMYVGLLFHTWIDLQINPFFKIWPF
jgi:hypothetical protein